MSQGSKPVTPFRGEFWFTDPKSKGITHFLFRQRKTGRTVEAWGSCMPTDCEWGEVPLLLLHSGKSKPGVQRAFATWHFGKKSNRILFTFQNGVLTSECISDNKDFPYYHREHFKKNAALARAARKAGPLDRLKHMWDGSERGWKLCRYEEPVFYTALVFKKGGPTVQARAQLRKYLFTPPVKSRAKLRKYWTMTEYYVGPHSQKILLDLQQRSKRGGFKLRTRKIDTNDYLILEPKNILSHWNFFGRYRPVIVHLMRDARVPIVQRTTID